jgi:D-sedoheptulose 7-phosphate isomerase
MGETLGLHTQKALAANIDAARQTLALLAPLAEPLGKATELIGKALTSGHTLLSCGNGGSSAQSSHFIGEVAGRFLINRGGFPAIDLTTNASLVTALINDFPADELFERQVRALGRKGDVLTVFTTSGNSGNVLKALDAAKEMGIGTVSFLGRDGGKAKGRADVDLIVNSPTTARIQEAHLLLYHTICQVLDPLLAKGR